MPGETSEALAAGEPQTRHGEMELEIVIIDEHVPDQLVSLCGGNYKSVANSWAQRQLISFRL